MALLHKTEGVVLVRKETTQLTLKKNPVQFLFSSGSSWLHVVPWGLRKLLVWLDKEYDGVDIYVMENGMSDRNSSMTDDHRVFYYKYYINEVLKGKQIVISVEIKYSKIKTVISSSKKCLKPTLSQNRNCALFH